MLRRHEVDRPCVATQKTGVCTFSYAITAHSAQGVTVDTADTIVTDHTVREDLYAAMTRGRHTNPAVDRPENSRLPRGGVRRLGGVVPAASRPERPRWRS
jgi:hypothetical protein